MVQKPIRAEAQKANNRRRILTFEPCGPVGAMLESELKKLTRPGSKRPRGKLRQVIQLCIVQSLGPKYPKLMDRYKHLFEEGAS